MAIVVFRRFLGIIYNANGKNGFRERVSQQQLYMRHFRRVACKSDGVIWNRRTTIYIRGRRGFGGGGPSGKTGHLKATTVGGASRCR